MNRSFKPQPEPKTKFHLSVKTKKSNMKVAQIMTPMIQRVNGDDSAVAAAVRMRNADVGALPVIGEQAQLLGIVTDRDLVVRGIAEGRDPATTAVKQIMTPEAITCQSDESVEQAAKLMESKQVRRLVVIDNNNQAIGIVSLADIAIKTPGNELAGEVLGQVSKPAAAAA